MKNYRTIRNLLHLFSCCCLLIGIAFAGALHAEVPTEEKIRLMSDALAARDAGDLETARENLQALLELSPDDPGLQRLLENIEANMRQPEPELQPELGLQPAELDAEELDLDQASSSLTGAETARLQAAVEEARAFRGLARQQADEGDFAGAIQTLEVALADLPRNAMTEEFHVQLRNDLAEAYLAYAKVLLDEGDLDGAQDSLNAYAELAPDTARTARVVRDFERELLDPAHIPIEEVSPDFPEEQQHLRDLLRRGRAQYLNGDLVGAESTFRQVEALDAYNPEAKAMLARIAEQKRQRNHLDRNKTREQMLEEIGSSWQRPQIYVERPAVESTDDEELPLEQKLRDITIPMVSFSDIRLSRAINTLSQASQEYDPEGVGVNLVLMDPDQTEPRVHINVRDLSLKRILDLVVDSVKFRYDIEEDAVIVRPGVRRRGDLVTENFPVSPATIQRLMGRGGSGGGEAEPVAMDDPFADPTAAPEPEAAPATGATSDALEDFLRQAAGVDFSVQGSNLLYDGSDLWVTQTQRNIERIRNVFRRLTDVRQVEIEARFLEVQESTVDELGFDWQVVSPGGNATYTSGTRDLAGAFAGSQQSSQVVVGEEIFPVSPPTIPGVPGLGSGAAAFAVFNGSIDGFDVNAAVRMLSQSTGADLLSAPKLTVMSGHQANINVAQEIRYPDSYGDTQSEVGRGGTGDQGSAGVTITPGTPQDFQMRRVGVELTVTPTVEQDNSVTLDLAPRVTEFEGFVEYGGLSIAISGGQTVTNPSGFYQPVFATREVNTRVNVWDGATVVMGGLTREDVRRVNDKVPVLGDIPVLGRLFRSEGEGSQKRNLLIFVTANLVSPGGSPLRQELRTVEPGALYQNPTLVVPSGAVSREKRVE